MFNLDSITRPYIKNLQPYSSARDEFKGVGEVFLDANENPYGATIGQKIVFDTKFNRYPDPLQLQLKGKISKIKGVRTENIFLGNGSDEAIELLIRAFCQPQKDSIVVMPPTYGMYKVSASINEVGITYVPLNNEFAIDMEALKPQLNQPSNKVLFACSPNNPSGNLLNLEDIKQICNSFNGLVVVDEAYIDFAPNASFLKELKNYPNLAILQTFSKAWGMANTRLGMLFASKEIIAILNKIKPPYNVNGLTQEIVFRSLQYEGIKDQMVAELLQERAKLSEALKTISFVTKVYPSDANFILIKCIDATAIYNKLVEKGIIVRNRSKEVNCDNCLRITIGTPVENERFIKELKAI